jgi:hypothetical protein
MGKASRSNRRTERRGPLLSACLIVRDEEPVLAECLQALAGIADEIVVHDTGSLDSSVSIARAAGATVIEGAWDDDFAAARNVSLEACHGTWVLHVDADELLTCDRRAFRRALEAASTADDAFLLEIENLVDDGTGRSYSFRGCRVFRRERAEWQGRIHEQVTARAGQPPVRVSTRGLPARIIHRGYLRSEMERHGKVERNLRLAGERAASEAGDAAALLDLGRSLKAAGRIEEAAERCLAAAELAVEAADAAAALHFAASCLLGLGRVDDARDAIARLRTVSQRPAIADFLDGQAALQTGNGARALELFAGIDDLVDDRGKGLGNGVLPLHVGMAHAVLGDWTAASDALIRAVVVEGGIEGTLATLIDTAWRAGRAVSTIPGLFDPAVAAAVVEEAGRLARRGAAPPEVALVAGAIATAAGDEAAASVVRSIAPSLPERWFVAALVELDALAPQLLPGFVEGAASTSSRGLAMAAALEELGAGEHAAVVREAVAAG